MKNVQKVSLPKRATSGITAISRKLAISFAVVAGLIAGPITAQAGDHVSQLTYLQWLVKVSGDSAQFNNSSTPADYVQWATAKGLNPAKGWQPSKNLSKNDLATTLVQYLGLDSGKKGDPMKILAREGIDLLTALADDTDVDKKHLVAIFDNDMFVLRVPNHHSPHKPPHPPHPPHPPQAHGPPDGLPPGPPSSTPP